MNSLKSKPIAINLDAAKLCTHMGNICKGVWQSTVLPILDHILVEIKDKKISFTSTDLNNYNSYFEETDCSQEITFLIPAKSLFNFFTKATLFQPQVTIIVLKGFYVQLQCGDVKIKISIDEDPGNYPKIPIIENEKSNFTIQGKELVKFFTKAMVCISTDELRPAMTGVNFSNKNGKLEIATSDAHRLYWDQIMPYPKDLQNVENLPPTTDNKKNVRVHDGFLVNANAARKIIKQFNEGDVKVTVDFPNIYFENKKYRLVSRQIDARFPDYPVVIPSPQVTKITFNATRKQLRSFLLMAMPFINATTKQITCIVSKDWVDLSGINEDSWEKSDVSFRLPIFNSNFAEDEPVKFAVNAFFMLSVVNQSTDPYVKINMSNQSSKAFIIDDHFLMMPLITNNA